MWPSPLLTLTCVHVLLLPAGFGYYKTGKGDDAPITSADLQAAGSKVIKCPTGSFKVSMLQAGPQRPACRLHPHCLLGTPTACAAGAVAKHPADPDCCMVCLSQPTLSCPAGWLELGPLSVMWQQLPH